MSRLLPEPPGGSARGRWAAKGVPPAMGVTMPNRLVYKRLLGIRAILNGVHLAGAGLSSASKGCERQQSVNAFLSQVLPPEYRDGLLYVQRALGAVLPLDRDFQFLDFCHRQIVIYPSFRPCHTA